MQLFFLFYFLNKYYFLIYFNILKTIIGLFVNIYFIIEYICIFYLKTDIFYYIILYKHLIKERLNWRMWRKEHMIIRKKEIKVKPRIKRNRIQYFVNKFWYYYYRKWMYWGWTLYFIDWVKWQYRIYKSYILYYYVEVNRWKYRRFKKRILRRFLRFFIFCNYNIIRYSFKLQKIIIDLIFFFVFLRLYLKTFLKIKIIYVYDLFINYYKQLKYKKRW